MKRLVFLTGTRADFGKLRSLIEAAHNSKNIEVHIFVTGMHLQTKYGYTVNEIEKLGYQNIFKFINTSNSENMDQALAKTVMGLSDYIKEIQPDMICVHGDRVEALAGSIVGALNNIIVAHIEGGEVSGTIDELIRHSVSKLSHLHLVANDDAKRRLVQMGEGDESVHVIGSPDIDIMNSDSLPDLDNVLRYYEIDFSNYAVLLFHPVTTEREKIVEQANTLVSSVIDSGLNFIVIYPNNDNGSDEILREYNRFYGLSNFRVFPSIRFESFLVLLKNASFVIGNSSAGIREAPYYAVPTINIGTRQKNRATDREIIHCNFEEKAINEAISHANNMMRDVQRDYGRGSSDKKFMDLLESPDIWNTSKQKEFKDITI